MADEITPPTIQIIREVYDSGNAQESFEAELDKALYDKVNYIIIEPTRLGDETGRWIYVGNCLHKTAIVASVATVASGLIWPQKPFVFAPFCAVSIFCTGLYTVSWNYDPCVKYQVEKDNKKLDKVPNLHEFSSPIVLVYTDNKKIKYLHRSVTLLALTFCAWKLYNGYK